jgi:hypothetical protein
MERFIDNCVNEKIVKTSCSVTPILGALNRRETSVGRWTSVDIDVKRVCGEDGVDHFNDWLMAYSSSDQ